MYYYRSKQSEKKKNRKSLKEKTKINNSPSGIALYQNATEIFTIKPQPILMGILMAKKNLLVLFCHISEHTYERKYEIV